MARYLSGYRTNPSYRLLGINLEDALAVGIGLTAAGAANDKVLSPIAKSAIAPLYANDSMAKVADGATTLGAAAIAGMIADRLFGARIGDLARLGGGALAIARAVSAVVPGWQISESTPNSLSFNNPFAAKQVAAPAGAGAGGSMSSNPGTVPPRPNATGLMANPPSPQALGLNAGAQGASYVEQFPANIGTAGYALQGGM